MFGHFMILDKEGQPLCKPNGKRIECGTRAEAEQFLKHAGERLDASKNGWL